MSTDWTVLDTETAGMILNYLGRGQEASKDPYIDPRRDHIARIIRGHVDTEVLARLQVTPEVIAAAWQAWHERHGGKLGPGVAFTEAVTAAFELIARPHISTET